jgi:LysR family transcriptional regulator for bpeEF and oprC
MNRFQAMQVFSRVLEVNSFAKVAESLAMLGLIRATHSIVNSYLRGGRLRQIVSELEAPTAPLSIACPRARRLFPAVCVFADWIAVPICNVEPLWNLQRRSLPELERAWRAVSGV